MPTQRHASIVDVHVILRRGGKVLLLRRTGDTYASGQLCLPSGHVDEGESVLAAAVRETHEETGITLDSAGSAALKPQRNCSSHRRGWTATTSPAGSSSQRPV